jgi:hypothetical protein
MHGEKIYAYRILVGMPEGMRNIDVGERITLRWILERACSGMEWFVLAQDSGQWRTPVNKVLNFQVPVNILTAERLAASLRSTQLHGVSYLLG